MLVRTSLIAVLAAVMLGLLAGTATQGQDARNVPRYQDEKRQSNASAVTILASSAASTYTRYVEDIQNVLDDLETGGLRIVPMLGRGGGQNFRDILFLRGIDMGTTDADYLRYFKAKDPALYANVEQRIQYVVKLPNAEFHVLAGSGVRSLADLKGRRVNFWKPLSVTAMMAETVFRILGVDVQPTYFDDSMAIDRLRKGEIAAMVRVSGAPHEDYVRLREEDGIHLVPLDEAGLSKKQFAELMSSYLPAMLTHEQYPGLIAPGQMVPTVASSIVLAVYNWPQGSERYEKLARFVKSFFDNFEKFADPARHPKWREVNLAATVPGWTRFKPAQEWLDESGLGVSQVPASDTRTAFESFIRERGRAGQDLTAGDREALYQQFLSWWKTREGVRRRN
jgi:uncharacterized protein